MSNNHSNPLCLLVASQLISKLIGVVLNVVMMRGVGPDIFAVSSRLDMITNTILSIGRESMRMALLRCTLNDYPDYVRWKQSLFKMSLQSSLIGIFIGLTSIPVFANIHGHQTSNAFRRAAKYYCMSATIEMMCEPFIVYFMHTGSISHRLCGEAGVAVLRSLIVGHRIVIKGDDDLDTITNVFGRCQLCLCLLLLAYYIVLFYLSEQKLKPSFRLFSSLKSSANTTTTTNANANANANNQHFMELYKQSFLKFILGQSDALVMNYLSPLNLASQGVYSLVTNYVGLFSRVIQAPLEETGYLLFSKTIDKAGADEQHRAYSLISNVIKFDLLVGCFLSLVGTQYAGLIGRMIAKDKGVAKQVTNVLSAACFLLPIMSMSGICEAFMNATMGSVGMSRMRNASMVLSVFSLINCMLLGKAFGGVGLVLASMANFSLRLLISFGYVYLRPNPNKHFHLALDARTVKTLLITGAACLFVGSAWGFGSAKHLSIGVAMTIGCVLPVTMKHEPELVNLFVK